MRRRSPIALFAASMLATGSLAASAGERDLTFGNQFLQLVFRAGSGSCEATHLVNSVAGKTHRLSSDEFSIGIEGEPPLRSADLMFREARRQPLAGGQQFTLRFESEARGVGLDIVYGLGDRDFFLRRRLELSTSQPLPIRRVDVWTVGIDDVCSHQGFGEPVFLEDTFWGVEYPSGHNSFADEGVKLSHFPGRTVDGRFVSKTAVLGVAEPERVGRRFREYVKTFQVTPKDLRLFVNYNTWWTLMPPTEANCLALIDEFRRKLFDPYGESFDTFTIDDGWDDKNSIWKIRNDRFPSGFEPLIAPLKSMNANLGLWLSPSSGYGHAPWGGDNGYERNSNPWYLCQSGPKYRREITEVVTSRAKQYDLAFYKFDGFCRSCEADGHGHLPGPYAVEANTDAYLELLTAARKARPGIFLDPTCGIWLSPWWVKYADSLWGSVSGDYPDNIVPAPILRDSATSTRDAVFRQRCREHPGFPPTAIEHLGIIVITPEKWEDNAMAVLGRGCRLLTLYLNPKHFRKDDRDWAFLASMLKWARHNTPTLANTELILGDALKREVYGYAHFRGQRGIIMLRNPFITPQTAKVELDDSVGWSRGQVLASVGGRSAFIARVVYPRHEILRPVLHYGDPLAIELQAYETIVLHVEPIRQTEPILLGARCVETQRTGTRVSYDVYGCPGENAAVPLVGAGAPGRALLDSQPLPLESVEGRVAIPLAFAGQAAECTVEGGRLEAQTTEDGWQLAGACNLTVPPGAEAAVHVLCDPSVSVQRRLECSAEVNGKPVEVRAVRTPAKRVQTHKPHKWTWFEFPVPAGRSEVAVAIKPSEPTAFFRGEVGWWLWAEHPLAKRKLTLEWDRPLAIPEAEPLPLPLSIGHERQVIEIQAATTLRAGNRWGDPSKPVVYLDETAPDESLQGWGKLQKNQSVWEKEMIIAGRKFDRGLGTHANGRLAYDLVGGNFRAFRCLVGRDEHAGDGRVIFQVRLDGEVVFDSGPMTKTSAAKTVEVNVSSGSTLELLTLDGGDGFSGDHGDWAEAELMR